MFLIGLSCAVHHAAWAQQGAAAADKQTVLLRSGAFYRGTLVERDADSHFVLQLRDGARVRIQLSEVLDETDEEDPPFRRSALAIGPDGEQRSGEVLRYELDGELLLSAFVAAPIRLPAAAKLQLCFVDTRETLVFLRDGAIQRGVIVERSEGSHLTLQTPDGKLRQVRSSEIQSELAVPPGDKRGLATLSFPWKDAITEELISYVPGAQVTLRSLTQGLRSFPVKTLKHVELPMRTRAESLLHLEIKSPRPVQLYDQSKDLVCSAPYCTLEVRPDSRFFVRGSSIHPSARFGLPRAGSLILDVRPGRPEHQAVARPLLGVGGALAGGGGAVLLGTGLAVAGIYLVNAFKCTEFEEDDVCPDPSDGINFGQARTAAVVGAGLVAGGAVLLIVGGWFHGSSRTSVRQVQTQSAAGLLLPLGHGLYLTRRGLAF
jgi:hypothetical protein